MTYEYYEVNLFEFLELKMILFNIISLLAFNQFFY